MINMDEVIETLRTYAKEHELIIWVHKPNDFDENRYSYIFYFKNLHNNYTWCYEFNELAREELAKRDEDMTDEFVDRIKYLMPELLFKTPRRVRKTMRDLSTPAVSMTVEILEDDTDG